MSATLRIFAAVFFATIAGCASASKQSDTPDFSGRAPDLSASGDLSTPPDLWTLDLAHKDLSPPDFAGVDLSSPPDFASPPGTCDGTLCPAGCVFACGIQSKVGVGFCNSDVCNCFCL
jgi:hypothetical protein